MLHPSVNIGEPFIRFSQVGSTNDEARKAIQEGLATHGMAFYTSNQVAGRGQHGKSWSTTPGASVALSVLIRPDFLTVLQQFELNRALALGLWDAVAAYAGSSKLSLKWPNDLYWEDKKLGGMLIESIVTSSGQWGWAIAGIGLNINQHNFDPSLPNPISLFQITQKEQDPYTVARNLCSLLKVRLTQLQEKKTELLHKTYEQRLYKKDQPARFRSGGRTFTALVKGVTENGELLLEGEPTSFTTGSIEWLLPDQ
ncbi:MAG: biotin--[acetyl-CoA-carboxylase] ligase [Sphingomonadales bacterium]